MKTVCLATVFLALFAVQVAAFDIRFDGHAVLSCTAESDNMARELGDEARAQDLDIWSHSVKAGKPLHIQVPSEKRGFWEKKYGCSSMIEDVQEVIDQQFKHAAMITGLKGVETLVGEGEGAEDWYSQYHRHGEIERKLKELSDTYKEYTKHVPSIGKSHEGRKIPVIHLSGQGFGKKSSELGEGEEAEQKPQIWINGGQHAREWIAPAAVMYMAEQLLKDYHKKPEELGEGTEESARVGEVKKLMDKFEFVIAPVINPDGYEYSHTGNRLWRKNRRKNDDGTYGVDMNRNWDNHWGEGGASTRPSATDYQGPSVASEPEVKACQDYIKGLKHATAGIDFHSYGDLILRSKGWTKHMSHDESLLKKMAGDMKQAISKDRGTQYKSETAAGLYPTTGSTDDWMSEQGKMWGHGWTVELPDSERGGKGFLLPASQIKPASKEIYKGLINFSSSLGTQHDKRMKLGAKEWSAEIRRNTEELKREMKRAQKREMLDEALGTDEISADSSLEDVAMLEN